ncbi:hypothetical protein [Herpetosiphon llansteffanensis]|uniref:hypothetical protein n=1 Tax=Herpetosiphon llansteffanensis TaxID=2094568 RepID=UPI000D7BE490|nr:hypothetical protein [Herpetosiphon llansteffanensis]
MSAGRFIYQFRVPEYWRRLVAVIAATIYAFRLLLGLDAEPDPMLRWGLAIMLLTFASRMAIDMLSYLDISHQGLIMRRGWQYFSIRWEQIESVGMALYTRRDLPYIVLREPIRGLPRIKIPDLTIEQQQRTLTLEGWAESEIIAKALHAGLNTAGQPWHVIPNFALSHRYFIYYQRLYLWILAGEVGVFAYFVLG